VGNYANQEDLRIVSAEFINKLAVFFQTPAPGSPVGRGSIFMRSYKSVFGNNPSNEVIISVGNTMRQIGYTLLN